MLTRIALLIGLFAAAADAGESYVVSGQAPHGGGSYVGGHHHGGCNSCDTGCSSCGKAFLWGTKCGPNSGFFDCNGLWCSPGNLVQHLMYYPASHGNYYFHPYNYTKIREQQQIAAAWGEDPYNPYAHAVFAKVYKELEQEGVIKPLFEETEDAEAMEMMRVEGEEGDLTPVPTPTPEDELKDPALEDNGYIPAPTEVPSFVRVKFIER